tara:strand:- start:603 stop:809 length:207 start_codon:yes stop_codon:yes gene_type:complete
MGTKTKKIQTIEDCKTLADVREGIESIIDQHDIMQARVEDYMLTYNSMTEALKWFLDPLESEGRKNDS